MEIGFLFFCKKMSVFKAQLQNCIPEVLPRPEGQVKNMEVELLQRCSLQQVNWSSFIPLVPLLLYLLAIINIHGFDLPKPQ